MSDKLKTKEELIEELKELREECKQKEDRLLDVIQKMPHRDRVFRYKLTEDGDYVAEPSEGELTGQAGQHNLKTSELTGNTAREIFGEEVGSEYLPYFERAFEGETVKFDAKLNGYCYSTVLFPFKYTEDGKVIEIAGYGEDTAKQKNTKRELKFTRLALENSALAVLWARPDGSIKCANEAACSMFGYTKDELANLTLDDIDPSYSPEKREEQWNRLKNAKSLRFETVNRKKDGTKFPVEVTDHYLEYRGEEFEFAFIQDITNRKKVQKIMADRHTMLQANQQKLKQSFVELAETASRILGVRSPYTEFHQKNVARLSQEVGKRMGLDEDRLLGLYVGGLLHDIGKINVPNSILTKPGELSEREWKLIKRHPEVGYVQILKDTDFPWPIADMTLHHHERLDGSGYPDGLEGDELSLDVRIISAVDVVEAMSESRPYRGAKSKEEVLEELDVNKGVKYDPDVADTLVSIVEEGNVQIATDKKRLSLIN